MRPYQIAVVHTPDICKENHIPHTHPRLMNTHS